MTKRKEKWPLFNITQHPCDIFLGFTADDSTLFGRATQAITDGPWNHVFIGFRFPDVEECYFEALLDRGVTGPWPIARLHAWLEEDLKNHRCALVDLPRSMIPFQDPGPALIAARSAVGKHSYFKIQLLAMALFERYGRKIVRSENKTVCSEYAAWVLQGIIDLRDRRRFVFDAVNPNSAWHRLCEELAGLGAHTRPVKPNPVTRGDRIATLKSLIGSVKAAPDVGAAAQEAPQGVLSAPLLMTGTMPQKSNCKSIPAFCNGIQSAALATK